MGYRYFQIIKNLANSSILIINIKYFLPKKVIEILITRNFFAVYYYLNNN